LIENVGRLVLGGSAIYQQAVSLIATTLYGMITGAQPTRNIFAVADLLVPIRSLYVVSVCI